MSHQARKRFGQNFLHDQNIIQQILAHSQASLGQHWVEIGPGQGALTKPLLERQVKLDVIELDRDLVTLLSRKFNHYPHLAIHSTDALNFDFSNLAQLGEKLHIIGNLPYNISTPLLFHLLTYASNIEDMLFMLQKEVVERICAEPGSKAYGKLSVMMQYYCQAEFLFEVPPESFVPVPKVMSAIVYLKPYSKAPVQVTNIAALGQIVSQAFSQRRKTVRNSLHNMLNEAQIQALGINPGARAETLSLAEFAQLANSWSEISALPAAI